MGRIRESLIDGALLSFRLRQPLTPPPETPITYREITGPPPLIGSLAAALYHEPLLISGANTVEAAFNEAIKKSRQYEPAYIGVQAVRHMHKEYSGLTGLEPTRIGIDGSPDATALTMMRMGQWVIDYFRGNFSSINPKEIPAYILKVLKGEVVDLEALCALDELTGIVVKYLNTEMRQNASRTGNNTALDFRNNTHSLVQKLQDMLSKKRGNLIQYHFDVTAKLLRLPPCIQVNQDTLIQRYVVPELSEAYIAQFPELGIPQNKEVTGSGPHKIMGELLRLGHPLARGALETYRRLEQSTDN
jgi:hypothetical protein